MYFKITPLRFIPCFISTLVLIVFINLSAIMISYDIYKQTNKQFSDIESQNKDIKYPQEFKHAETFHQKEAISISSPFGYKLNGIFMPNTITTNKTILFISGLPNARDIDLDYLEIYFRSGFNVLLIESQSHEDSGGNSISWGRLEKYDISQWVNWIKHRIPDGPIGIHGVALGAATALLHAELNENEKNVSFYIADSAYSDAESLFSFHIKQWLYSYIAEYKLPLLNNEFFSSIILHYVSYISYFYSHSTLQDTSPLHSVQHVTTPILYLHNENDKIVPSSMSFELQHATKGPSQLYLFPNSEHASALADNQQLYNTAIYHFLQSLKELN